MVKLGPPKLKKYPSRCRTKADGIKAGKDLTNRALRKSMAALLERDSDTHDTGLTGPNRAFLRGTMVGIPPHPPLSPIQNNRADATSSAGGGPRHVRHVKIAASAPSNKVSKRQRRGNVDISSTSAYRKKKTPPNIDVLLTGKLRKDEDAHETDEIDDAAAKEVQENTDPLPLLAFFVGVDARSAFFRDYNGFIRERQNHNGCGVLSRQKNPSQHIDARAVYVDFCENQKLIPKPMGLIRRGDEPDTLNARCIAKWAQERRTRDARG
jgi:hypothetical protein